MQAQSGSRAAGGHVWGCLWHRGTHAWQHGIWRCRLWPGQTRSGKWACACTLRPAVLHQLHLPGTCCFVPANGQIDPYSGLISQQQLLQRTASQHADAAAVASSQCLAVKLTTCRTLKMHVAAGLFLGLDTLLNHTQGGPAAGYTSPHSAATVAAGCRPGL